MTWSLVRIIPSRSTTSPEPVPPGPPPRGCAAIVTTDGNPASATAAAGQAASDAATGTLAAAPWPTAATITPPATPPMTAARTTAAACNALVRPLARAGVDLVLMFVVMIYLRWQDPAPIGREPHRNGQCRSPHRSSRLELRRQRELVRYQSPPHSPNG